MLKKAFLPKLKSSAIENSSTCPVLHAVGVGADVDGSGGEFALQGLESPVPGGPPLRAIPYDHRPA